MKQAKTRNRLRKAAAAMAIPALLLVLTSNNALCQSPGQTVEEKYPGLLSGVLKNARLASMDEQILCQSGNATINRAGLAQQLNAIDGAARLQLEKNLLFLLDQEATRAILLNEAEKAGFASRDVSDGENLQAFFDHKSETIKVTENEARSFYLENTLPELVSSGVKVAFVDAAFSRKSALYARYFLYATKAASSPESIINARSVLFDLAEKDKIESEPDMVQALKENNVDIKLVDTQPLMDQWKSLMKTHNLRSTPACVILKPGKEPRQHRGGKAIPEALGRLLHIEKKPVCQSGRSQDAPPFQISSSACLPIGCGCFK